MNPSSYLTITSKMSSTLTIFLPALKAVMKPSLPYAHNRIAVNGLGFGQNVRDMLLDAITIDLKNVKFSNIKFISKVKLGSQTLVPMPVRSVKHFIKNVYHGNDAVNQGFFSKDVTNRNSNKQVGQIPAIQISAH